jgi:hypothetical protein
MVIYAWCKLVWLSHNIVIYSSPLDLPAVPSFLDMISLDILHEYSNLILVCILIN